MDDVGEGGGGDGIGQGEGLLQENGGGELDCWECKPERMRSGDVVVVLGGGGWHG